MTRKLPSRSALPIPGPLTPRPMAGYEIRSEIDASFGNFWRETSGQLYPQLKMRAEAGLIEETPGIEGVRGKRDVTLLGIPAEPYSAIIRNRLVFPPFPRLTTADPASYVLAGIGDQIPE